MAPGCRRSLPDFMVVGPQRTGTTWLAMVLRSGAALADGPKDNDFFLHHYSRGLDWYRGYFRNCPSGMLRGDVDSNYFGSALARGRVARDLPWCRIVCTLRDPAERAFCSYKAMRRDAWTRIGFEETVKRNPIIRESSRYAFHLRQWQESFGKEKVLVCFHEDLVADPQAYLDRICSFIGIPSIPLSGAPRATARINSVTHAPRSRRLAQNARNARDWMRARRWHRTLAMIERAGVFRFCFGRGEEFPPVDPEVEERLRYRFLHEVEALEELTGRDLSAWKPSPQASGGVPVRGATRCPASRS